MPKVAFEQLNPELQKKINSKSGRGFTIAMAVLASLIFPLVLMFVQDRLIERPKDKVDLTYHVNQSPYHPTGEHITYIEVENIGLKSTGESPIILEVQFRGKIISHEWQKPLHTANIIKEKVDEKAYELQFKNFGPGAICAKLFKTKDDLTRQPILSYNAVLYTPTERSLNP